MLLVKLKLDLTVVNYCVAAPTKCFRMGTSHASIYYLFIFQIEEKRHKKEQEKRSRVDKDRVMDMLFAAFEKHQYYNVKDLVGITKQPIVSK